MRLSALCVLYVLLLCSSAHGSSVKACVEDLFNTGLFLEQAAEHITAAVTDCKSNSSLCTIDVASAVASLGQASKSIAQAAADCGGSNNTQCAQDVSALVANIAALTRDVAAALQECNGFSVKCLVDVAEADVAIIEIVEGLDAAIKQCGANKRQRKPMR